MVQDSLSSEWIKDMASNNHWSDWLIINLFFEKVIPNLTIDGRISILETQKTHVN